MSHSGRRQVLALGDCQFDGGRRLLLRDGEAVALRPKAFALLEHLAANPGRVVGKAELMDTLWPNLHVTEDSLTQAVRDLRKALGESGETVVRTVARRGYLLAPDEPAPAERPRTEPAVAVLRFVNVGDAERSNLVDGFAEDVAATLARFRAMTVLAGNSTFAFSSAGGTDWSDIGRRLAADYLVRGRMSVESDAIAVAISLVESASGAVLWSENFSAAGSAIFDLQEDIAWKIANRLVSRLADAVIARSGERTPASLAAYECLVRGLAHLRSYRDEDNRTARRLFGEAVVKDPAYALAHAYVALADLAIGGYADTPPDILAGVLDRAEHAVVLAPEDPRCHRVLASARLFAREHEAAEHYLRRSLSLNPCDADTMAHMSFLQTMRGKPLEALAWLDRAVRINPIYPGWYEYDRSIALYSAGAYREAITCLSRLPVKTPWRLTRLAACHAQLGELDAARRIMAEVRTIAPDYEPLIYARVSLVFEHASDTEHVAEGVAKAVAA